MEGPMFAHHHAVNHHTIELHQLRARMIMPPMVTAPLACPILCRGSEDACIKYRLTKSVMRHKKLSDVNFHDPDYTIHSCIAMYTEYFVTQFQLICINATGSPLIEPYTTQQVIDAMPKRLRAEKIAKNFDANDILHPHATLLPATKFELGEHNRNISPINDCHTTQSSRFTYAFDSIMHTQHEIPIGQRPLAWWMPGCKPVDIATQVKYVARHGPGTYFGADYKSFDGTQTAWMRDITVGIMRCLFPNEADYVAQCIQDEYDLRCRTTHGCTYRTQGTMCSGSPWTTIGNTILNGFVYFCASLLSRRHLHEVETTMNKCALYGDDSLGPHIIQQQFHDICKIIGLVATDEDVTHGPSFLGRIYPVYNTKYSICDPLRVFTKLHATCASLSIPVEVAAVNRLTGYRNLCINEFWIRDVCDAGIRMYGKENYNINKLTESEKRQAARTAKGAWPFPPINSVEYEQILSVVCQILNIDVTHLECIMDQYRKAKVFRDLPCAWIDNGEKYNRKILDEEDEQYMFDPFQGYTVKLTKITKKPLHN